MFVDADDTERRCELLELVVWFDGPDGEFDGPAREFDRREFELEF